MVVKGQVHGAIAQGIGQALFENCTYDPESGQLLAGSYMDYAMPRADVLPSFTLDFQETPATNNPLGVKGAGESDTIGAPPAVANAVVDALWHLGVHHRSEEHTSELQSLMRISYAVFCLKKKTTHTLYKNMILQKTNTKSIHTL